ncbi:serine/threonine-protein kinase, partial [Sorangium cellulosum]|uniref:serine/threonine-protein kinase n=1 Tax=Sorangium cellulosum TaxID=56 RepID=UPI000AB4ECD3
MHGAGPQKLVGGRFELERIAGSGGMGDVYRARDRQDGALVALKLLRSSDAQLVARFQREARLLAELRHPAIARHVAHGVSEQGQHYLAMEWLEGEDLAARLARGPLDVDEGLALVHRVAEALALVHARGVIHRDLKPANLFLQGGRLDLVKILDFGIARDTAATGGLTEPGEALGLVSVVLARVEAPPPAATGPGACAEAATLQARGKAAMPTVPTPLLPDLRRAAAEHGGRLDPLQDGGVAAILIDAAPPTDLAARAVRCGLALRKLLPGTRLAVATGWDSLGGGQPVGPVIDRASALLVDVDAGLSGGVDGAPEAQASVLVDAVTATLLGPGFETVRGPRAHAVLGERDPFDEARTLLGKPTPFVGRDRELRALEDLFDECAGEPCARAGLVMGAAGMGKSRLRLELVRRLRARAEPVTIWVAQADPARVGAPLDLLGQVVRRAAHLVDGEPLERRREQLAARVARHVEPALRERVTEFLGEMVGTPFPDEARVQLRAARRDPLLMGDQVRRAWVDFIDAECRAGPVLVVLEDLHWGDVPTVQCIDAALRQLLERPLMVLALARPEVRATFPALWADRGAMEIGLPELPRRACERMVRAALGDHPDDNHVTEIVQRAAGNPFFVEELVRATVEGRDAREAPETVLAMVQARFKDLDAEERRLLRAGSVLGEVFWQGAAARLLGLEQEQGAALGARLAA